MVFKHKHFQLEVWRVRRRNEWLGGWGGGGRHALLCVWAVSDQVLQVCVWFGHVHHVSQW